MDENAFSALREHLLSAAEIVDRSLASVRKDNDGDILHGRPPMQETLEIRLSTLRRKIEDASAWSVYLFS